MATRLLLLADTHVPKRARALPRQVWQAVEEADLVLHAGDWVDERTLDDLHARAGQLVGVYGNNDHGLLRERLPEWAEIEAACDCSIPALPQIDGASRQAPT